MLRQLTDDVVRKFPAPTDKAYLIQLDGGHKKAVQGFGVRVTKDGTRSFILIYRCSRGREHRYTIGRYPSWTVAGAREEAKRLRRSIDVGGCPVEDDEQERMAATVNELADRYLGEHVKPRLRPSSVAQIEGQLRRWIRPDLGGIKVKHLRHEDVDRLHRAITAHGTPYEANRVRATLSKMCALAKKWGMRADNPVEGVQRNQEHRRERYLSTGELARLTRALAEHGDQHFADFIRLLLLTGARRGEVLSARWSDFDLGQGVWTKPAATTKQKKMHRVPLNPPTRQLLVEMRERVGAEALLLFPELAAKTNLTKRWAKLCREAELVERVQKRTRNGKPVVGRDGQPVMGLQSTARIHDLRHTFASLLVGKGLSLPIIGALLGHTQPTTTARYAHLAADPLQQATDLVGGLLAGLASGKKADVVEMPARGKR